MQVFLSYSYTDHSAAAEVRRGLETCGFEVWSDELIRPGESISERIAAGLDAADAFVVLLGRDTASRQWSMLEIGGAIASGKRVVPVLLAPDVQVPHLLADRQYLDFSDPASRSTELDRLCQTLRAPMRSQRTAKKMELLEAANSALRLEERQWDYEVRRQAQRAFWLQIVTTVIALVVAVMALIFSPREASPVVSAIVAGLGATVSAAVGYYLGYKRERHRDSDRLEDRR